MTMQAVSMQVSKLHLGLFIGDRVMIVSFVDDILFQSTDQAYTNKLGSRLRDQGLLLEQEDNAAGYLGVKITKTKDGQIEMNQTGLLDRVVEALGLDHKLSTSKWTLAEATPLTHNEDGEPPQGSFSYASVVGMLLFLSGHLRPGIAYAVNCCVC